MGTEKRRFWCNCSAIAMTIPFATAVGIRSAHSALQTQEVSESYTITATMRLAKPYDLQAMNDEFQTARMVSEADDVGTFEITYKPFHEQNVTANPNWQHDDAGMREYLQPRLAANWDTELQQKILSDLHEAGIDPAKLDDKTLVEKVSNWALQRSTFNQQFGLWMVEFKEGKPVVAPELQEAFSREEPKGVPETDLFAKELFGKGMYETKTHGACTSTSTYLTTILRAVGIPTRIILTVPACDPNDSKQVTMLENAVRHHGVRRAIHAGMANQGFVNHVFNEVWIGGKWVRLNYNRLGQPIVDRHYCGLMTHVYTVKDISEVPFAKTWGARYGVNAGPKLSSVNPYQLLSAHDDLKPGTILNNPEIPYLTVATVTKILRPGDSELPEWVKIPPGTDAVLSIKEWLKEDDYVQLRDFVAGAGTTFVLRAPNEAEVEAQVSGAKFSDGNGTFQAIGLHLIGKLKPGVVYQIIPQNEGHKNTWVIPQDIIWREP